MPFKKKHTKIFFQDASSALEGNSPSRSYGVCFFDIDGDGWLEILVANATGNNIIYKYNDEKRNFKNVAPENFRTKDKATLCLSIGDFLGNGTPAVYMLHSNTFAGIKTHYDHLFIRTSLENEELVFKDLFDDYPNMSNPYAGRSVAAVDYNGSGQHAFYVANYNAPNLFYHFNPESKQLEERAKELGLKISSSGRSVLAQYIVSPNSLDIFLGNENDCNALFKKNTDGKYKDVVENYDLMDSLNHARGIAVADFDGNGLTDVVVGTWEGLNSIFMQKEAGVFTNLPPAFFASPRRIRNLIVADFDNDGNEEIFINTLAESNHMFRYLGNDHWEELDIGPLASKESYGTGAAVGDLTGNGFLDIFIATGEQNPQKNRLYLGVANDNKWLRIQPLTQSKFPALGAKVRLFTKNGKNQTKFICSGSGYLCQMEPVAHFGLGAHTHEIDYLEITWPGDGIKAPHTRTIMGSEIAINSYLQIPHPLT